MHSDATSVQVPAATRADIAKLHEFEHWPARWMWPMFAATIALGAAAGVAYTYEWPLLFILLPLQSAFVFVFILSFHDASHGRIHPIHWVNEVFGHAIGTAMFVPLNVYRYAHARHHAQLGRPGDPELWPFNAPGTPRPVRVLAAFVEIVFGFLYTPLLFVRSVVVGQLTPRERQLVVRGYVACVCFWAAVLAVVYDLNLWPSFLVLIGIPAAISGALQTLNKFEQHLGLHGNTVIGLTRTVVDRNRFAEMISAAMLYNDYHGTHHRYAKIPYYHLPLATPYALSNSTEYCPVFPSLVSATLDMFRCLADPKVGPQWTMSDGRGRRDVPHAVAAPAVQPVFTGEYDTQASFLET